MTPRPGTVFLLFAVALLALSAASGGDVIAYKAELEALSPESPVEYVRLGKKLIANRDDAQAMALGRRLLLLAARLNPERHYAEAHRSLAGATRDPVEAAAYLRRLLLADPFDRDARREYEKVRGAARAAVAADVRLLIEGLEALRDGAARPAAARLDAIKTRQVRDFAAAVLPGGISVRGDAPACSVCGNTGQMLCSHCKGYGSVRCTRCNGLGRVAVKSRGSRSRTRSAYATCEVCRGTGETSCPKCHGAGRVACTACRGRKKRAALSAKAEGQVNRAIRKARARLHREGWWLYDGVGKVPSFGTYIFASGIDYEKTVYRSGAWRKP